ncbi:ATPase family associated with various cellular activities, putative isoform 1 [Theobroma cacao]|uniref:ATPase family associated with various cellular activities, putative isoform 1 n=1 Tax=Theobroma cacao TaxID=3641 RepID=A0A061GE61_THECC|nr:ATPase family associated with various cellular activities, putative isoform 1 [Theobroma cacao]
MPSPATILRRSSPNPDLIITTQKSETLIPRSSRSSTCSSRPTKFSYWTSWSNINKLGDYINPRRLGNDSSKHSDLTEESLDAHNKLHGILSHRATISNYIFNHVDEKNHKCSPYYKGLIDLTLSINREKNISGAESPGRVSHTTTVFTTTSSTLSSFFVKVQEFSSSCFTCRKTGNQDPSPAAAPPTSVKTTFPKGMKSEKKEATDPPDPQLVDEVKPLRERVSEPSAPPTLTILPTKTVPSNDEKKEADTHKGNQKFIWADKYRPKALKDFICNKSEATRLQALVKYDLCDHVIFEGPPGVGKRTMIWAMLREAFGPDGLQTRDERKAFDLKGESIGRIEVNVKESSQHVEVNLSDLKGYEKDVIVELMKETQTKTSKSNKAMSSYSDNCRVIILCEADKLSTDALLYIKWLLERYEGDNKVFFCCSDVSRLQPIRSICKLIRLLPPSKEEIVEVLEFIAKQEDIYLPTKLAEKMAESSKNNLRQAIRSFEACWHSSYPFKEDQVILTGWEDDIANIAKNIVEERSPKQLYIIRGKLQILIEHDVSPDFIFKSLVEEVKKHMHENLHTQVDGLYDEYNRDDESMIESEDEMSIKVIHPVRKNMRIFLRIEEFIARFMSWYNNQLRMANAGNTPLAGEGTSCDC